MAEDIKINGLNHNLVVRPTENGTYELISGERRFTALSKLVLEGHKQFINIPCKVVVLFKLMHKLENYPKVKSLNKLIDFKNYIKLKKLMVSQLVESVRLLQKI
ncbi:ParB N-terminal domain-containing protein [Clostridium sp.]|uniref:ParB N-terminal domain-containing protein n=1 Tax=Clostridium sp. TaxID=1506 RepID=UPI00290E8260|nr:ParB N-terminal domain-containing protein [Clostridium sp.]MDU3355205.1 ParB N-terminal domain-containing protein [Clostridium sp.]